jgi:tetratricopeptide (TPR) repeat protein
MPRVVAVVPLLAWVFFAIWYGSRQVAIIDGDVHLQRGMQIGLSSPEESIHEYHVALVQNPTNLLARSNLTAEYLSLERWSDALKSADDLRQLSPSYPKSRLMEAYALVRLERYDEALETIQHELLQRSHPESFLVESAAYRGLADTAGEREALKNLLKKDIASRAPYGYRSACLRLLRLCDSRSEREEFKALLDSLAYVFAADQGFFEEMKTQAGPTQ